MADFEMTLPEAITVAEQVRCLGYPSRFDMELLDIACAKIAAARTDVRARYLSFRNTPSEGPSKTKLPASPDAGGGPIPQPKI